MSEYRTSDLALAATLTCSGFPCIHIEKGRERRVVFCFAKDNAIEPVADSFFQGNMKVDASTYYGSLHELKNRIHQPE